MCGPDAINYIPYDGKDPKVKAKIEEIKAKLETRKQSIEAALDAIKNKLGR